MDMPKKARKQCARCPQPVREVKGEEGGYRYCDRCCKQVIKELTKAHYFDSSVWIPTIYDDRKSC